jgi:hypothetical protein
MFVKHVLLKNYCYEQVHIIIIIVSYIELLLFFFFLMWESRMLIKNNKKDLYSLEDDCPTSKNQISLLCSLWHEQLASSESFPWVFFIQINKVGFLFYLYIWKILSQLHRLLWHSNKVLTFRFYTRKTSSSHKLSDLLKTLAKSHILQKEYLLQNNELQPKIWATIVMRSNTKNRTKYSYFKKRIKRKHLVKCLVPRIQVWKPPSLGYVKVNEDVVVNKVKQRMGIGIVVQSGTSDSWQKFN